MRGKQTTRHWTGMAPRSNKGHGKVSWLWGPRPCGPKARNRVLDTMHWTGTCTCMIVTRLGLTLSRVGTCTTCSLWHYNDSRPLLILKSLEERWLPCCDSVVPVVMWEYWHWNAYLIKQERGIAYYSRGPLVVSTLLHRPPSLTGPKIFLLWIHLFLPIAKCHLSNVTTISWY